MTADEIVTFVMVSGLEFSENGPIQRVAATNVGLI